MTRTSSPLKKGRVMFERTLPSIGTNTFLGVLTVKFSQCAMKSGRNPTMNDPITVINNLSDFIFSLIRALGLILLGFGIVQIGLSLKSHDPSQRANGFMTLAGGVIITFAKEILNLITGGM